MKTSFLPPAKTLLLNVTMAVVLLPFFAIFAAIVYLSGVAVDSWSGDTAVWEQALLCAFVVITPLCALVMIVWKGWSRLPLLLLLLALPGIRMLQTVPHNEPSVYRHIDLLIGQYSATTGVDVFCNGAYLGQTPMRISREEFNEKVPPWTKPPRQDRLEVSDFPGMIWYLSKYTWVPKDIFGQHGRWPPVHNQDDKDVLPMMKSCRYWWRFEANGHQGISGLANFGDGSSGSAGRLEVSASPQIQYPALAPHLALVVAGLDAAKGPPSAAWIAHFRKCQNLLFLPFYDKARSHPRLRSALDAVVRAEFDLPQEPTPRDCDRILAAILDRVELRGCFQIPSPESIAIDLMGDAVKDSVVRHYREESSRLFTSGGQRGGGGSPYTVFHRSGKAARQLPLEYAVNRLRPPELFDAIVYRWAKTGQNLKLVACYQDKPAVQLVIDYLQNADRQGGNRFSVNGALATVVGIVNPAVEPYLRNFVQEHAVGPYNRHYVAQFVESRIGAPGIDQNDLVGWVHAFAPLDDREKQRLLPRINGTSTATYIQVSGLMRDPSKRQDVIYQLAETPNPSLDRLLIDAYNATQEPQFANYGYGPVTKALIRIDTPAVRKFITGTWQDPSRRAVLLDSLTSQDKADLARLAWMTPLVEQLTDAAAKTKAAKLLASFHTPEAQKLLDRWLREGNADVRNAVERQYEEQQKQDAEHAHRLQQWSDLLAGTIQPEDLVPPQRPWDWNGKEYVQRTK